MKLPILVCAENHTCVSKTFPPLNSLQRCQSLTEFQKFCTAGKRMKFATRNIHSFPPHLGYVATLPCEVKNSHLFKNYKRCNSKIVPYVIKMKHYMPYG